MAVDVALSVHHTDTVVYICVMGLLFYHTDTGLGSSCYQIGMESTAT